MPLRSGEWVERGRRKYSTPLEEVFQNKVGGDSGFDEVAGKMRDAKEYLERRIKKNCIMDWLIGQRGIAAFQINPRLFSWRSAPFTEPRYPEILCVTAFETPK